MIVRPRAVPPGLNAVSVEAIRQGLPPIATPAGCAASVVGMTWRATAERTVDVYRRALARRRRA